jgi:predicted alpha-1,2-mannosidase
VGIRDFDINTGYAAALKNELDGNNRPNGAGKLDTDRFLQYGFVNHIDKDKRSGELWQFSASHTLEYSFSAYAVAQWAKQLGKKEDEKKLAQLSNAWKKIFDPSLKLIRPKWENGQFIGDFKPTQAWRGFQEGNAVQYTFYVPHDPYALVKAIGKDSFNIRLNRIFEASRKNAFGGGTTIDAFAGLEFSYNHGNQPCLHIPWLFNYSGKPSLTQKWVRTICNEFYGTEGIHGYGYGQDEDQGQLGAWYVISSIGLFDVKGLTEANPSFGVGSPLFDRVTIELNRQYFKGKEFVIETVGNNGSNIYVNNMILNGRKLTAPFLSFAEVAKGGRLQLHMSAKPRDNYSAAGQK